MVYWMGRDPVAEVNAAMDAFAPFGKPVMPIGQAYDGGLEGGDGASVASGAVGAALPVVALLALGVGLLLTSGAPPHAAISGIRSVRSARAATVRSRAKGIFTAGLLVSCHVSIYRSKAYCTRDRPIAEMRLC